MKNTAKRIVLIALSFMVFTSALLLPFQRAYAVEIEGYPQGNDLLQELQLLQAYGFSDEELRILESMIAAGGLAMDESEMNFLLTSVLAGMTISGYRITPEDGRYFADIPLQTMLHAWDFTYNFATDKIEGRLATGRWTRNGNQITPPNHGRNGFLGVYNNVPIIQDGGGNAMSWTTPFIGPSSVTLNGRNFAIVTFAHSTGQYSYSLVAEGSGSQQLQDMQRYRIHGFVILQVGGAHFLSVGAERLYPPGSMQTRYWVHRPNRPLIPITPFLSPPPQPIHLRPINIIDNRQTIENIVREITNVCCGDCRVRIWLPPSPIDWLNTPPHDLIFPSPEPCPNSNNNNNGDDDDTPCPTDPGNACNCDDDDGDGFFTRFWNRFTDSFGGSDDDGGGGWFGNLLDRLPSPSLPEINTIIGHLSNIVSSITGLAGNLINSLLEAIGDLLGYMNILDFVFDLSILRDRVPNFMEYFPFSLPMALYNTFRVMAGLAPREVVGMTRSETLEFMAMQEYVGIAPSHFVGTPPRIEIEIPSPFYYTFVFDMGDYMLFIGLIRWSTLIIFTLAMIKITPHIIKL